MMQNNDTTTEAIARWMEQRAVHGIPDGLDLWPRIQQRVAQQAQMPRRQNRFAFMRRTRTRASSCLAVVVACAGLAVSTTPALREALAQVIAFIPSGHDGQAMSRDGHPLAISPTPPFRVFYSDTLSSTKSLHAIGQWYGNGTTLGTKGGISSSVDCPNEDRNCNTRARHTTLALFPGFGETTPGLPSIVVPVVAKGLDVVWFGMHGLPPDVDRVEIAEWDAKVFAPSAGLSQSSVGGTTVTVVKDGTAIEVQTTLGLSATQRIADSLHAIDVNP